MSTAQIIGWIAVSIVLVIEIVLIMTLIFSKNSPYQNLIKNLSPHKDISDASYSYSRTQLMWWSIIVLTCFVIDFAITGEANGIMNSTALTLLGISAGTTLTGRVIDNSQSNDATLTLQQHQKSQGFWTDILSDQKGVSIHRFQAVIFNIAFGFAFIVQFIGSISKAAFGTVVELPYFNEMTLGLIGLSSATYATLKFNENLSTKNANNGSVQNTTNPTNTTENTTNTEGSTPPPPPPPPQQA